ncbi:MAG: hypothetical protein LC808_37020, partial [Actinobacteria bacterium]|nr:hypothetical protein [Actinomycetota bacterium]
MPVAGPGSCTYREQSLRVWLLLLAWSTRIATGRIWILRLGSSFSDRVATARAATGQYRGAADTILVGVKVTTGVSGDSLMFLYQSSAQGESLVVPTHAGQCPADVIEVDSHI